MSFIIFISTLRLKDKEHSASILKPLCQFAFLFEPNINAILLFVFGIFPKKLKEKTKNERRQERRIIVHYY